MSPPHVAVTRSVSNLEQDARTLYYEFESLVETSELLRRSMRPSASVIEDRVQYNSLVESFSIHARSLTHFFYWHTRLFNGNRKATDIVAADYSPNWSTICPTITPGLEQAKRNADKQVAHMTEDRRDIYDTNTGKKTWNYATVASDLGNVMAVFLNNSANIPGNLVNEFHSLLRRIASWNDTMSTASVAPPHIFGGIQLTAATVSRPIAGRPGGSATGCNE